MHESDLLYRDAASLRRKPPRKRLPPCLERSLSSYSLDFATIHQFAGRGRVTRTLSRTTSKFGHAPNPVPLRKRSGTQAAALASYGCLHCLNDPSSLSENTDQMQVRFRFGFLPCTSSTAVLSGTLGSFLRSVRTTSTCRLQNPLSRTPRRSSCRYRSPRR